MAMTVRDKTGTAGRGTARSPSASGAQGPQGSQGPSGAQGPTLGWSASLAIDPSSGAHNPRIEAGQYIIGGAPATTTSDAPDLLLYGDDGGSVSGAGGAFEGHGGDATTDGVGGDAFLLPGSGKGAGRRGGYGRIWAAAGDDGAGGGIDLYCAQGVGTNRAGGPLYAIAGNSTGTVKGAEIGIEAGDNTGSGAGGNAYQQGGRAGPTGGAGGDSYSQAGSGVAAGTAGGNAYLRPGAPGAGGTPGQAQMRDSSSVVKFAVNTVGIGYFATTPVAKQTVTGSLGGNAALTSLCSALATYGLITNSTSA